MIFGSPQAAEDPAQVPEARKPISEPDDALPPPQIAGVHEASAIRGIVVGSVGQILIVRCERERAQGNPVPNFQLDASAGAAGIASMAKWAGQVRDENIRKEFGPLKILQDGLLRDSQVIPRDLPSGEFAVEGYPFLTDRLHVVAASTGRNFRGLPVYSVVFSIEGKQNLNGTDTSFVFPPEIDTPEKRRAYLKSVLAQRNSSRAEASESPTR